MAQKKMLKAKDIEQLENTSAVSSLIVDCGCTIIGTACCQASCLACSCGTA